MNRLLAVIAFLATLPSFAQSSEISTLPAQSAAITAPGLTVADVISLHQASISDSIVIARLEQQNHPMSLTIDDMIQLKNAGVPDAVVRAMLTSKADQPQHLIIRNESLEKLHSMNPTGATPPYASGTPPDFNDPMAPHDSGIYLATTDTTGKTTLTFMDRAGISGVNVNVGSLFSFFAVPLHYRYAVPLPKATIRTSSSNPVFYFYFDDKSAALGKQRNSASDVSTPSGFLLEPFITSKKERELTTLKFGIFTGVSDGEKHLTFTNQRLRPGLYKVTVNQPLKPGEYTFVLPPARAITARRGIPQPLPSPISSTSA